MPNEWIVYTKGTSKYINKIYNSIIRQKSDFEWKKEYEDGQWVLYFRPKSYVPEFMNVEF